MKNVRLLYSLLFAVLLAGSAGAVTEIYNCQQLQNMRDNLAGDYVLKDKIDCGADPFNIGQGFEPIGYCPVWSDCVGFSGSFDGGGFTISNLYINRPGVDRIGLVALLYTEGTIQNVHLEGVNISGNISVGGLVGHNNGGTISNCSTAGTVTANDLTWGDAGGLVGQNEGGLIEYSSSSANVSGQRSVGGLIGENDGGEIAFSSASGNVTGSEDVGGLVGKSDQRASLFENLISCGCFATGDVSGQTNVGGLIGYILTSSQGNTEGIDKCYATGDVSATGDNIGGLIGTAFQAHIHESFATGDVSGSNHVGGLVGYQDTGVVHQSFTSGIVSNSYALGSSSATGSYKGGLVGTFDCGFPGLGTFGNCYGTQCSLYGQTIGVHESVCKLERSYCNNLTNRDTFVGWAFADNLPQTTDVWDIDTTGTINYGYPYLLWTVLDPIIVSPAADMTIEVGESVDFAGMTSPDPCTPAEDYVWRCSPVSGCPEGINGYNKKEPGEKVFDKEGVYTITFNAKNADGWGVVIGPNNTRIITVSAPSADLSLVVEPKLIEKGGDFTEASVTVTTASSSPVNVNISVKLVDSATHQPVAGRPDNQWVQSLVQDPPFEQDLEAWLDEETLAESNYTLSAVVKKAVTNEVLAEDSLIFTVGPAKRVPVPELNEFLLPLLLSIVLFVLWKKNERLIDEKEAKLVNKGIELEMQGIKQGKVKTKSFAAIKKKYKL
jgi:hypothetical protein